MASSDHPKDWVRHMVSNRGLNPPAKTLYWWSIHIERFLAYCKKAGPLASERPECSAPRFLSSINRWGNTDTYGYQQAQQAIDLFISELDHWHWNPHDRALSGPHFRLKVSRLLMNRRPLRVRIYLRLQRTRDPLHSLKGRELFCVCAPLRHAN